MSNETRDNTIDDIHRIRRDIAAKYHGDVCAINADAQSRTEASGRQIIRRRSSSNKAMHPSGESAAVPEDDSSPAAG
jgi:hypothetical protein